MAMVTWLHGYLLKCIRNRVFPSTFENFSTRPRGMWKPGAWTGDMERDSVESGGGFAEEGEEGSVMVITFGGSSR